MNLVEEIKYLRGQLNQARQLIQKYQADLNLIKVVTDSYPHPEMLMCFDNLPTEPLDVFDSRNN